jgi:hypothetical protein
MYFYYIAMKIYILVYANIYSPIYFPYIIIMPQPFSYHGFYTLLKPLKINLSITFISLFYKFLNFNNKLFSLSEGVSKVPNTYLYTK